MDKTMHNFSDRLKSLRQQAGLTQSELAKKLSLTRASVNAWEMGLSAPSTPFVVELSKLLNVTTDYLLGLADTLTIRTDGLNEKEVAVILNMIECLKAAHQED